MAEVQGALQRHVDSAISKTVQVREEYPFEQFQKLYELAYDKGLKGCTILPPNPITGEARCLRLKDLIAATSSVKPTEGGS